MPIDLLASRSDDALAANNGAGIVTDTHYVTLEDGKILAQKKCVSFDNEANDEFSDNNNGVESESSGSTNDDKPAPLAPSIISSVLTREELSDSTGFFIVCWMVFLADMSRGVVFPTMWPLIRSLGGTEVDLGYAVAAFSLGRALCAPVFGKWSISLGYGDTLLISAVILLVGTVMYAQAPHFGSTNFGPSYVTFSQILLGIGSGTLGVSRAYTAEVTAQRVRTTYLAWLSAVQYFGFSVTPLMGSAMTIYFEKDESRVLEGGGFFLLNAFTAPGYFLSILSILTIIILRTYFQNGHKSSNPKKKKKKKSKKLMSVEEVANTKTFLGISTHTACILGCFYLNIVIKGAISCFETLGVQIAQEKFGMTSSYAGMVVSICGAFGVAELLMMGYITRMLTDIQLIVGGTSALIVGMSFLIGLNDDENNVGENGGWRYILSMFMVYSVGYSVAQAAVLGMFSKVVGRVPQGEYMGWFSIAGAVSRIVYPLASGYIVYHRDIGLLFSIVIGTLIVSIVYVLMNRKEFEHLSL